MRKKSFKISKKKLKLIIGWIVIVISLIFWVVDIQLWPAYTAKNDNNTIKKEVWSGNFETDIHNITWEMFIWPDKQVWQKYLQYFVNTDDFLYLQNYEITQNSRKEQFQNLTERNIPVKMILENKIYAAYTNYFQQVQDYFAEDDLVSIQSDDPMGTIYVHTKMMVNEDGFRIQTANLTKSSFESNREHFYYSTDEGIRQSLVQLFETDREWSGLKISDLHPNLVVCPLNCRAVVEKLLKDAKSSITIQTQYIMDTQVLAILRSQSELVDLKIILADTEDNQKVVKYFGKNVARILTSNYNHTKMILIDDKYLLLWSMNLSDNSLDNNREIWIILLDSTLIQQFKTDFMKDWNWSA